MSDGIKDKVAVIGAGCTKFGERWDVNGMDLILEAFKEAVADAGIDPQKDIEAAWFGTSLVELHLGKWGIPLAETLHLPNIGCTRVENACCTGTEAVRGAAYAIASGAYDITMALGVEKLKDMGYAGIAQTDPPQMVSWLPASSSAGCFALLATAYFNKWKIEPMRGKEALARISAKSHYNGSLNPKAHLRKAVSVETIMASPIMVFPLGLFDCCGVSDGSACVILCRADWARKFRDDPIYIKALQVQASSGETREYTAWDGTTTASGAITCAKAYKEAGVTNPRQEITMAEVHDCFSITELVVMEDAQFSTTGGAVQDVFDGRFELTGACPVNYSGGLKSFGHPIGATGCRMVYEAYKQFQGKAQLPERQLHNFKYAFTHNLGGDPSKCVTGVTITGRELG